MIDIHTHILPGMDDGAVDILDTIEMARLAAMSGVTEIVATPHFNIPGLYDNAFGEHYVNTFNQAARAIKEEKIPIRLFPGMGGIFYRGSATADGRWKGNDDQSEPLYSDGVCI